MSDGLRTTRQQRRALASDNRREPEVLRKVARHDWPSPFPHGLLEVWRSRDFLVQVFCHEANTRLSVCRTELSGRRWKDDISWEDLQRLKRECGRGEICAVELYPPDKCIVNVANMRHLWLTDVPVFMWGARND